MMAEHDLMRKKLKDFCEEETYVFLTIQFSSESRVFFYNGYVKKVSSDDVIFLDDISGEIPIAINVIKSVIPSTKRVE